MEQPLITVIVPVYKAEDYLERCVSSICGQTYTNLEIILVDDGSPDRCGEICDALAKQDARIRVIHKENGGQSSARNRGLDEMRGEYVAFVDSDDWIESNMYESLYKSAVENNAQIAACGMQENYPDGKVRYFNPEYPDHAELEVYDTVNALRVCLSNTKLTFSPCDKLYHKSIFANIRMTEGAVFEDMEMAPKCLELAQKVTYDPYPYYHYMMTPDSTLRGTYSPRLMRSADIAREKAQYYKEKYPELYTEAMVQYVYVADDVIMRAEGIEECRERRSQIMRQLRRSVPKEAMQRLRRANKLKMTALNIHPAAYCAVSWILRGYLWTKNIIKGARHAAKS